MAMTRIYESAMEAFSGESFGAQAFQLQMNQGAQPWEPRGECLKKLQAKFADETMIVHLWPRSLANRILGRPTKPYAFRAFTRGVHTHVFVDPTETRESICWLIAHELSHQLIDRNPALNKAMDEARSAGLDPAGDLFHEVDAEERFCDGIATKLIGKRLDRTWWRRRTTRRVT